MSPRRQLKRSNHVTTTTAATLSRRSRRASSRATNNQVPHHQPSSGRHVLLVSDTNFSQPRGPSQQRRSRPEHLPSQGQPRCEAHHNPLQPNRYVVLLPSDVGPTTDQPQRQVTTYIDVDNPSIPIRGPDARTNSEARAASTRRFQLQLAASSRPPLYSVGDEPPVPEVPCVASEAPLTLSERFADRLNHANPSS